MRDFRNELLAFAAGLAAGAGVALLIAPQTGNRTRRQIRRKAEDAQDSIEDLTEDLVERGRDFVDRSAETANQTIREFRKRARASVG